jgi:hypothetical protein
VNGSVPDIEQENESNDQDNANGADHDILE